MGVNRYSTETPKELVRALYNRFYPDFHAFKTYFPGLFEGGAEGVKKLKCSCVQCLSKPGLAGSRPGTCGAYISIAIADRAW